MKSHPSSLREYELYAPLTRSDGRRLPPQKLALLKRELTRRFGGLTYFPQRNLGLWKINGHVYHDRIVILRVLANAKTDKPAYWQHLKHQLQKDWQQESILIVSRSVSTH